VVIKLHYLSSVTTVIVSCVTNGHFLIPFVYDIKLATHYIRLTALFQDNLGKTAPER